MNIVMSGSIRVVTAWIDTPTHYIRDNTGACARLRLTHPLFLHVIHDRQETLMNANGRRQRQAKNGFAHLSPRQRPNYRKRDAATSAARLQRQIANERRMAQGKKKK